MERKYELVNLSINFSEDVEKRGCRTGITRCKPGGSYVCVSPSKVNTCPPGSCGGTSVIKIVEPLEAELLIRENDLENLRNEMETMLKKYAKE